jgi:hypothetical protein
MISSVATLNLQQASAFGFVEQQQVGEFRKLTGEFVQNIISRQQSPNSEDAIQFRQVTAQFERDVINAVLNDHFSLIPGLVSQHTKFFGGLTDDQFITEVPQEIEYTQEVLRIFCRTCI